MNKVTRLIGPVVALLSAAATVGPVATNEAAAGRSRNPRPNVLLIITDDQRSGYRSMPSLKRRIVRKGTRYPNAFATTPACCPARASIFTGKYSHNHGVISNLDAEQLVPKEMLQYHLDSTGYRTGIIGKYLNKWWKTKAHDPPPYFDSYLVVRGGRGGYYYDGTWNHNGRLVNPDDYSTTLVRDESIDLLSKWEREGDRTPWFLVLSTPAPHPPAITLPRYRDAKVPSYYPPIEKDKSDKPPYVQAASGAPRRGNQLQKKEKRALMPVDDMVGRVMRHLERKGELNNTLVVYVSDNAVMWGEHGLRHKTLPYTEDINVPLYMSWRNHFGSGTVDKRLVGNIDIAPTILEAARVGKKKWQPVDGNSLLDSTWDRDRIHLEYLAEHKDAKTWAVTRTLDYQYTEYYDNMGNITFREYYDLQNDPLQMRNLYGDGDPLNDPPYLLMQSELAADTSCEGDDCP